MLMLDADVDETIFFFHDNVDTGSDTVNEDDDNTRDDCGNIHSDVQHGI